MKRPPVLRPRLATFKLDNTQNRSLERIVQPSRNSSAEQKERTSHIMWNVLGHKPRAQSINKENSFNEPKSSRESLNYAKETLKKPLLVPDPFPRTPVPVSSVRNTFYSAYEHMQSELEKFEKIRMELLSTNKH